MNGKKWAIILVLGAVVLNLGVRPVLARQTVIADHLAPAAYPFIPDKYIQQAISQFNLYYGHTSHGSQIVTGLEMLQDATHSFYPAEETGPDLGYYPDWVNITRTRLNQPGNDINMVMWSWCGQVSGSSKEEIDTYLQAMNQLEQDFPQVIFIYMTGHTDGSGIDGNLNVRNNQIRDYCRRNGKVLFDFADIESWNPAGSYFPDTSDDCAWCSDWCTSHTCPDCGDCAHSHCFNCYLKGKAFYWLLARLAGWNPGGAMAATAVLLSD
ncbi:MAG: hypothetical protein AB1424_06935 [Thermodesulfobacteriota bacterium]